MRRIVKFAFAVALAALAALAIRRLLAHGGARPGTESLPPAQGDRRTRDELYREAQRLEIEGRSKMNKQELHEAVEAAKTGGAV
jgi:hypothetical protein